MNPYDAVIFDLDGTLLNTLDDLADSVNYALEKNNLPCRTLNEVRQFVGNGVALLLSRAVPLGTEPSLEASCLKDFQAHYLTNMQHKTAPYIGVTDLLHALRDAGVKTAVVSNKFDGAVKALCPVYFQDCFDVVTGESASVFKKPAPDMVFKVMTDLDADPERTVYIGDSDVDIETARNAGLPCISVTCGFRSKEFLQANGAQIFAESIDALWTLLI